MQLRLIGKYCSNICIYSQSLLKMQLRGDVRRTLSVAHVSIRQNDILEYQYKPQ